MAPDGVIPSVERLEPTLPIIGELIREEISAEVGRFSFRDTVNFNPDGLLIG